MLDLILDRVLAGLGLEAPVSGAIERETDRETLEVCTGDPICGLDGIASALFRHAYVEAAVAVAAPQYSTTIYAGQVDTRVPLEFSRGDVSPRSVRIFSFNLKLRHPSERHKCTNSSRTVQKNKTVTRSLWRHR